MRQRTLVAAALFGAFLALASPALAEDTAKAKVHFQRGMAAFELGVYLEALREYELAYQLAPLPGLLFNIGQCHRNLGDLDKAVSYFRRYLRKKPDASNREAVATLIRELEVKIEASRRRQAKIRVPIQIQIPVKEKPPVPPPPPPPKPFYKRGWFWSVLATSVIVVAGGATGIYFGTRSRGPDLPDSRFQLDFSRH